MGCWGYQILCDDTAWDAMDELCGSENLRASLLDFLWGVLYERFDECIDYDACQYGLVAAAVVDAGLHGIDWSLLSDAELDNEAYRRVLTDASKSWLKDLETMAYDVVGYVLGDSSELKELWEENTELYPKWRETLNRLRSRLYTCSKILPVVQQQICEKRTLNEFDFFSMAENADSETERLITWLAYWPDIVIFAFDDKMTELLYALDNPQLAEELYGEGAYISSDDFLYARCAALVRGRAAYLGILNRKKKLPKKLRFEEMLYIPAKAWARKHGKSPEEYPHETKLSYETGSNKALWGE